MKISEILYEAKVDPDFDDDEAPAPDADQDKIPNIFMQMRKAVDTEGNYEFKFLDGSKQKLDMKDIVTFVKKYTNAKPLEKEMMQNKAIQSPSEFMSVVYAEEPTKPDFKIKGSRYMSSFAGDYDDK
jgi:hypothetical protein